MFVFTMALAAVTGLGSAQASSQPAEPTADQPPAAEPGAEPAVAEPGVDPSATEPVAEPGVDPSATEPVADPPATEPAAEPVAEPAADPPVAEPAAEPVADPAAEPAADVTIEDTGRGGKKKRKKHVEPWRGLIRVGGLTDSGPLPDVGLAGELAAGVNGPWVSFQGFGRAWLPRRGHFPEVEEPGVRAWAWAAGARGCFRHVVSPAIETPACLGAQFGQVSSKPFGVDEQPVTKSLFIEVTVTTGVTLTPQRTPWLALVGAFESGFNVKSDPLLIGNVAYHEPSHTALRAFINAEFRFPNKKANKKAKEDHAARRRRRLAKRQSR